MFGKSKAIVAICMGLCIGSIGEVHAAKLDSMIVVAQAAPAPKQSATNQSQQSQSAAQATNPPQAKDKDNEKGKCHEKLPQVSRTIEIDVPVEKVWAAIQARRVNDPGHRKLVSYDGKNAVVKEFFPSMPVLGSATCTYTEHELTPKKLISYEMLSSDHFHKFEGMWQLNPGPRPDTTMVSLTTTLDPGIRFPFWEQLAKANLTKDLINNLQEVAEICQSQISNAAASAVKK